MRQELSTGALIAGAAKRTHLGLGLLAAPTDAVLRHLGAHRNHRVTDPAAQSGAGRGTHVRQQQSRPAQSLIMAGGGADGADWWEQPLMSCLLLDGSDSGGGRSVLVKNTPLLSHDVHSYSMLTVSGA